MNDLVYKYVTHDRIDVLKDARIRFTQPAALNDPFETCPCLTDYEDGVIGRIHGKAEEKFGSLSAEATRQLRRDMAATVLDGLSGTMMSHLFAFLSLSRVPDHLLMWSHYAGSHTGFVIGFDSANEFFSPGRLSLHGLKPVKYSRDRFVMPPTGLAGLPPDKMEEANEKMLFTKNVDWEYEQEMRLLAMPRDADKIIPVDGPRDICLFNFPREAVRHLILGIRMPDNFKVEIAGLIEEKYPHVELKQARIDRRKFALEFVSYSQFAREDERLSIVRKMFSTKVVYADPK
jgi:Protein of unknown function (DUF2971)